MATKSTEQLNDFISQARAGGKSDSDIKSMLLNAGWDEAVFASALTPVGELVPPPPPAPKSSGREIFFYLLQFITLGIVATSLGSVIFALIDRYLPSEVAYSYYNSGSTVPWPLASLIVVAPVFFVVTFALVRDISNSRTSAMSKIRRLLIYIVLFLASATVIGDVIALVYRFLAGELNTRFFLKVITILVIGGWVVAYYYITVKRDEHKRPYPVNWQKIHGLAFIIVILVAIIVGFILTGSPLNRQKLVRDNERLMELQNIYYQVQNYYDRESKLPENLEVLAQGYMPQLATDPVSGQPYQYVVGDGLNYQLCATFETDDKEMDQNKSRMYYEPIMEVNWSHPTGEHCFDLKVTPRIVPK